ncbi:MAG: dTDP-4-dehydrorhamnose 3,5-epimerase [Chloroflexota bacterium]
MSGEPFTIHQTALEGVVLIEPRIHRDARGFFLETFRRNALAAAGIQVEFVQDNQSRSAFGTLRGLHFHRAPGQAKLIRVASGRIFDVAVDLRHRSPTFGRHVSVELDDREHRQLFIPAGFAHGFCVLSPTADVVYRVSTYYVPALERGIAWNDPDLAIGWPIDNPVLSSRDQILPLLADVDRTDLVS